MTPLRSGGTTPIGEMDIHRYIIGLDGQEHHEVTTLWNTSTKRFQPIDHLVGSRIRVTCVPSVGRVHDDRINSERPQRIHISLVDGALRQRDMLCSEPFEVLLGALHHRGIQIETDHVATGQCTFEEEASCTAHRVQDTST